MNFSGYINCDLCGKKEEESSNNTTPGSAKIKA